MIELTLLIPSLILAYFLWDSRRELKAEREASRAERAELLDRIQVPDLVVSKVMAGSGEPLPAPLSDMGPWEQPPPKEEDE